jgi:hypothetical protein
MKRILAMLFLFLFLTCPMAVGSVAALSWLEEGVFPEGWQAEEGAPAWGAWFMVDGSWLREAVDPGSDQAERYFADLNGRWFLLHAAQGDSPVSCDPPEWYPWGDTPEKRGLPSKGREENSVSDKSRSFSWGEWETHFGGRFRRVNPPGQPLTGAAHLVDSNGSCYILIVYPGATPRRVEMFSWFPGFPPGWAVRPGTTVLVNKAAE